MQRQGVQNTGEDRSPDPDGGRQRTTLRTVAELAGVSIATASHAFNRPDRIAPATRERVLSAARALGYSGPNPAARALRKQNVAALTVTGPTDLGELWSRPAAVRFCEGAAVMCDRSGVSLTLSPADELLGGPILAFRPSLSEQLAGPGVVVADAVVPGHRAVLADTQAAAGLLIEHLAGLGHRHLVVIGWEGEERRRDQLIAAWAERGPVRLVNARGLGRGDGEVAAVAALGPARGFTAVAAVSDELALGAMNGAARLGLEVPRDLSVVGIDDIPEAEHRGLTTAFVPYAAMGEAAAELALSGGEAPPAYPVPVALRGSTASARRGSVA